MVGSARGNGEARILAQRLPARMRDPLDGLEIP